MKPIFVITLSLRPTNFDALNEWVKEIEDRLSDYHVLIFCDGDKTENNFQLFSVKDIKPIEFEELKKMTIDSLATYKL